MAYDCHRFATIWTPVATRFPTDKRPGVKCSYGGTLGYGAVSDGRIATPVGAETRAGKGSELCWAPMIAPRLESDR